MFIFLHSNSGTSSSVSSIVCTVPIILNIDNFSSSVSKSFRLSSFYNHLSLPALSLYVLYIIIFQQVQSFHRCLTAIHIRSSQKINPFLTVQECIKHSFCKAVSHCLIPGIFLFFHCFLCCFYFLFIWYICSYSYFSRLSMI